MRNEFKTKKKSWGKFVKIENFKIRILKMQMEGCSKSKAKAKVLNFTLI